MVNVSVIGKPDFREKDSFGIQIADKFKDVCPPHKREDLPTLIKNCSYDEKKVQAQIMEWWEEPQTVEEKWENVSKKNSKRITYRIPGSTSIVGTQRGINVSRGRGRQNATRSGSRGRNNERRYRDYGGGKIHSGVGVIRMVRKCSSLTDKVREKRCSTPIRNIKSLQNELIKTSSEGPINDVIPINEIKVDTGKPTCLGLGLRSFSTQRSPILPGVLGIENGIKNKREDIITSLNSNKTIKGNVWVTKGSAHLIEAEKPRSISFSSSPGLVNEVNHKNRVSGVDNSSQPLSSFNTVDVVKDQCSSEASLVTHTTLDDTISVKVTSPSTARKLKNRLSSSLNVSNNNVLGWDSIPSETTRISASKSSPIADNVQNSSIGHISNSSVDPITDNPPPGLENVDMRKDSPPVKLPHTVPRKSGPVLNMGHWETVDGEGVQSLDFRFGSFGPGNDIMCVNDTTISSTTNNIVCSQSTPLVSGLNVTSSQTIPSSSTKNTVTPSRPPPGLSINMPELPANAIHVYELENKLDGVSLPVEGSQIPTGKRYKTFLPKKCTNSSLATNFHMTSQVSSHSIGSVAMTNIHQGTIPQNYPASFGITTGGIYSYNTRNTHGPVANTFIGIPNPQHQHKQLQHAAASSQHGIRNTPNPHGVVHQQHGNQYGSSLPATSVSDNPVGSEINDNSDRTNPVPGIPQGIANSSIAYPQLYFQHQYQIGQPGVSYGFGYGHGQYGAVQGSYGYQQQLLSQSGGYGQSAFEDQTQHLSNHNQNSYPVNIHQNYNKNGIYRIRNNHRNNHINQTHHNNQYQAQYSHQGYGGYTTQPCNIGYNDHFNQCNGYNFAGNVDPYMHVSTSYHSGINNSADDQQLGKVNKTQSNSRNVFVTNQNIHQYQYRSHYPDVQNPKQNSCSQVGSESLSHTTSVSGTNTPLSYQNWGNGRI